MLTNRVQFLAAVGLVVTVGLAASSGAASAPATGSRQATDFAHGKLHDATTFFASEGKRGSFRVWILSSQPNAPTSYEQVRTWRIVPEPAPDVTPTGQYVQVTGRGRVVRIGGHKQGWSARLEGFVTRPGEAKQRVVITMKERPKGVFVLTPLEPGVLKRDSGALIYMHATG